MFAITDLFFVEGEAVRAERDLLYELELNKKSSDSINIWMSDIELLGLVQKGVKLHFADQNAYENFKSIQLTNTQRRIDALMGAKLIVIDQ